MNSASNVINIGPAEQRRRRVIGAAASIAAAALLLWLDRSHAGRWWRIAAFPLVWMAALGFLQARAATCVMLAARGELSIEPGERCPASAEDSVVLTDRSRTILRRATLVAAMVTLAALTLP
jgi:hypothetical protein